MAKYMRLTNTPPIVDIDDSLWTLFVRNRGFDAEVAIQICTGFDFDPDREQPYRAHKFDGEWHEGDTHLFLETDAALRLLGQLQYAFGTGERNRAVDDVVADQVHRDGVEYLRRSLEVEVH
jgi:hypothetical protein